MLFWNAVVVKGHGQDNCQRSKRCELKGSCLGNIESLAQSSVVPINY